MAALHDADVVGNLERNMGELLDEQHPDALGGEPGDDGDEPGDDHRRKAERQFVGQDIARTVDDRLREHHHLLLAARERAGARAQLFAQFGECFERGLHALFALGPAQVMAGDP